MLISLEIQSLFLRIVLIYFHNNLSSLGENKLLYFLIACKNFSLKKKAYIKSFLEKISFNNLILT